MISELLATARESIFEGAVSVKPIGGIKLLVWYSDGLY
jgi:hypothetical protein